MISGYYTATPNSGIRPLEVEFSGISNVYTNAIYKFNFDDGSTDEYGQLVTHTYTGPTGEYNPSVTIIPNSGDIRGTSYLENFVTDNIYSNLNDYWEYNLESGRCFLECTNQDIKRINIDHNVSGDFTYDALFYVNTDIADNASGIGISASGDTSYVSMQWHGDSSRLWSEYSGEVLDTINISGGHWLPLWMEISRTSGTYYQTNEDSYSGCSTNIWGGQEFQNDVVTNKWITYRLKTISSGVFVGSDINNSGTVTDYISSYSGDYETYGDNATFKDIYFNFPCNNTFYLDNIEIYQRDGLIYNCDFENDIDQFDWITNVSGEIKNDPTNSSNKCLKITDKESNAILHRSINLDKSIGKIDVYFDVLYPSGEYSYNQKEWSDNNSIYVDIVPNSSTGYRAKFSPKNFISYSTGYKDYELWSLNSTTTSGNLTWKYRTSNSGDYQTLTNSGIEIDDVLTLGIYNGYSASHDNHRLYYLRAETDTYLSNSGINPFGSQDTWLYDDFGEYDYSLYTSSGFYPDSGIFYDISESGIRCDNIDPTSTGVDPWRRYSCDFSGNFQLDTLIYSKDNESQGVVVSDSNNSDNYIKMIYGSEGLNVNYVYSSPSESGFNIPNTDNLHPFNWWSRIKKVEDNNGEATIYTYWASGEQYPSEWTLASSGDYNAEWIVSDSNYSGAYSSFEVPDTSGMFLKEIRLHSEDRISPVYESGIQIYSSTTNVSGIINGIGEIYSRIYYDPKTIVPDMGSKLKRFVPVLINQRVTPYRAASDDKLQSKIKIYKRGQLYQKKNIPVELWLDHTGDWELAASGVTNRYGITTLYYNCNNIDNIDCCLGYAKVTIGGNAYKSNTARYNFINLIESPEGEILIIDAGDGDDDRSDYDLFIAGTDDNDRSRHNLIDRMFGV